MNPTRNRPVIAFSVPVSPEHRDVVERLLQMLKPVYATRYDETLKRLDVCFSSIIDSGWFIDQFCPLIRDTLNERINADEVTWYEEPVVPDRTHAGVLRALVQTFEDERSHADALVQRTDLWARCRQVLGQMQHLTMQALEPDNARDARDIKP